MAAASSVEEHSSDEDDGEREIHTPMCCNDEWSGEDCAELSPTMFGSRNITQENQETPLHLAILQSRMDVAVKLIRQGADVNATNINGLTPLHYAIWQGNVPVVCMLLYYNADVHVVSVDGETPWQLVVARNRHEIASVLINYYSEDDAVLMLAKCASARSPAYCQLLVDAVEAGGDITGEDEDGNNPLIMSLTSFSPDLFKLMWSKFNRTALLDHYPFFLFDYVTECSFAPSQWLQGLYLILNSEVAVELARNDYKLDSGLDDGSYLFYELLRVCKLKDIDRVHLVKLIYILLGFGTRVNTQAVEFVHHYYGFGDELEAILNCALYYRSRDDCVLLPSCLLLATKADIGREEVFLFLFRGFSVDVEYFLNLYAVFCHNVKLMLGFFAMPRHLKLEMLVLPLADLDVKERLCVMPEVPSLVELSRNQARVYIRQVYRVEQVYQFYEALRKLNYPQVLKDVICFKRRIY